MHSGLITKEVQRREEREREREFYGIRMYIFIEHQNPKMYASGNYFVLVYSMPKLVLKL